jgi:hypothetical protein
MDDNNLLMIVLAFIVGFMLQGMMENMCGGRQVRYFEPSPGSSGSGSSGSGSSPGSSGSGSSPGSSGSGSSPGSSGSGSSGSGSSPGSSGSGSEPCKSPIYNSCQSGYCALGLYPGQVNGKCAPMPDELQKEIDKLKYDYWTSEFVEY